ncbi:MAG: branched-chain-amino-acid transaminase [Thermoguttaceae bacterium]|nr:branched-chain-amino-acid transaminase [Thermoguttaceae bacterium]
MSLKVYVSGRLVDQEDAKVSVYDHGFLYGDGIFEGMRCYNGRVFRLKEHLDRLWDSAQTLWMKIPMTKEEMSAAIYETLKANNFVDAYIRLVVTRGRGTLGLDAHLCSDPQVIIITNALSLYTEEFYEKGLKIVTASTIRMPADSMNPRVKSLNYLNNIMAKIEAYQAGCEEALMLNHKGEVAECTGDNIFILRKGKLLTPPTDACILEGVTRNAVIDVAHKLEIPFEEKAITRHDVYCAEECFMTGSAAELIPVVEVDGRVIGSGKLGPVTRRILNAFRELVRNE